MSSAIATSGQTDAGRRASGYHDRASHPPVSAALLQAAAQASAQESPESPEDDEQDDQDGGDGEEDADVEHVAHDGPASEAPTARRKKRSRACQACRGMKIRCLPVEGQQACKACSKVGRACVMPGPARKRQKTVHKVAELEKKIEALTASLASRQQHQQQQQQQQQQYQLQMQLQQQQLNRENSSGGDRDGNTDTSRGRASVDASLHASTPNTESPQTIGTPSTHARAPHLISKHSDERFTETFENKGVSGYAPQPRPPKAECTVGETSGPTDYVDVIARNIISMDMANAIYERWKREMCPFSPFVAFHEHVTIDWLRVHRPFALLAILGVACGTVTPEIQSDLMVELARQLADRVMFLCEKSIDLAQAMLIYPTWYGKHKMAKDLGYNQYIHSAVTMCLDLGLGKRCKDSKKEYDEADLEKRRLWMGCYYMVINVTTVMRVPSLVKFSPYMEESLEILSTHPNALPNDLFVCSLVRLMHIAEDVGILFQMNDPGSSVPLNDTRTQYHLKMFERQLDDWKRSSKNLIPEAVLDQYHSVMSLYVHEIALHNEHNVDDFRPMAAEELELDGLTRDHLTNAHFEALTTCVDSMESSMAAFSRVDLNRLRGLPSLHMVWIAYVAVAMIRLHGIFRAPNSKYAEIFLPKMNVERHLNSLIAKLQVLTNEVELSPAEAFLMAFKKLRVWLAIREREHQASSTAAESGSRVYDSNYNNNHNSSTAFDQAYSTMPIQPRYAEQQPDRNRQHSDSYQHQHQHQHHHQQQQQQHQQHQRSPQPASGFPSINRPLQDQQQQPSFLPHQTLSHSMPTRPPTLGPSTTTSTSSSALLDSTAPIDPSAFDIGIGDWDIRMGDVDINELNNFDTYMNDVGWMGYLI